MLIIAMLFASTFLFFNVNLVQAEVPWLGGWGYRKSHIVLGAVNASTEYQIMVTVHYGSGTDGDDDVYFANKAQTDFDDVRFTDNDKTSELKYCRISYTVSGSAVFWVKLTDDLSSTQTFYVYYGNAGVATTSSIEDTFIFAEDWSSSVLNTARWTSSDAPATVDYTIENASQRMLFTYFAGISTYGLHSRTGIVFPQNWRLESFVNTAGVSMYSDPSGYSVYQGVAIQVTDAAAGSFNTGAGGTGGAALTEWYGGQHPVHFCYEKRIITNGSVSYYLYTQGVPVANPQVGVTYALVATSNGYLEGYEGGALVSNETLNGGFDRVHVTAIANTPHSCAYDIVSIYGFKIRQYVNPEPANDAWGTAESVTIQYVVGSISYSTNVSDADCLFSTQWYVTAGALSNYIFSWNTGGGWVNNSYVNFASSNMSWSNVTENLNVDSGTSISWTIYGVSTSPASVMSIPIQTFTVNDTMVDLILGISPASCNVVFDVNGSVVAPPITWSVIKHVVYNVTALNVSSGGVDFKYWLIDGIATDFDMSNEWHMDDDLNLTATYYLDVNVTVTSVPELNFVFTVDGAYQTTPYSAMLMNRSYTYVAKELSRIVGMDTYTFASWDVNGVAVTTSSFYTDTFQTATNLTMTYLITENHTVSFTDNYAIGFTFCILGQPSTYTTPISLSIANVTHTFVALELTRSTGLYDYTFQSWTVDGFITSTTSTMTGDFEADAVVVLNYGVTITPPYVPPTGNTSSMRVNLYFRSDTQTSYNMFGYRLWENMGQTNTTSYMFNPVSGLVCQYGVRVWTRGRLNTTYELTGGSPDAIVTRISDGEGIQSANFTMAGYNGLVDCLVVKVYGRVGLIDWALRATFVTKTKWFVRLPASEWTFSYYTKRETSSTNNTFMWGSPSVPSMVSLTVAAATAFDVMTYNLGSQNFIGFLTAPWTFYLGDLFYAILILFLSGTVWLRFDKFEPVLFIWVLFGGAGGVLTLLLPAIALNICWVFLALGLSIIFIRLIR